MSDGVYNVVIMYTSTVEATFKLAVGDYISLLDSSSPSITAQLPAMVGDASDMCTRIPPMSQGCRIPPMSQGCRIPPMYDATKLLTLCIDLQSYHGNGTKPRAF